MKYIGSLLMILSFFGCKECEEKPIINPGEIAYSFYPERREYHVGDTIYFSSSTDTKIFPTGFNPHSDRMGSQISVFQYHDFFSDSVYSSDAAKKFDAFIIKGTEVPNPESLQDVNIIGFRYIQEDSKFLTEIGIVLKDDGVFTMIPGSGGIKTNADERCEDFQIFYLTTDSNYNNWMLYDSLNNISSTPESRKIHFTFIVKPK